MGDLTVDRGVIESEADLERYQQLLRPSTRRLPDGKAGTTAPRPALPSASAARPAGRPRAPMMLLGGWRYGTPAWTC